MKRFITVCSVLLLVAFLSSTFWQVSAQVVKVKREAMSPGRRSSGPPNYTAPSGPNYISSGLRIIGKGMKVYLSADTTGSGSNTATSFAWSFIDPKPAGSKAVFDNVNTMFTSFKADTTGVYYVQVLVNGTITAVDTIRASTYVGVTSNFPGCALGCHNDKVVSWQTTPHADIFKRGITGQLEVDPLTGKGAYGKSCAKCHTTGWESVTNNGNFGFLANQIGWDTSWYKPYPLAGGSYLIPYRDSSVLKALPVSMLPTANIGCESCHGPGKDHYGQKANIGKSLDAGVCNQCHDAPKNHRLGSYYNASDHALMSKGHASSTSCYPCHSGSAFVKWLDNKTTPGWSVDADGMYPITCSACHDPHGNSNPNQLRTVSVDSLNNGYIPAAGDGGKGQFCMNCHRSRYSVAKRVTTKPPLYGFVNNYGPHGNPQADMFFGQNAYQYGDVSITGQRTHAGVADGCVTCHMAERVNGSSVHSNHEWAMEVDGKDFVVACQQCHGPITSFEDIKASYDYDKNGVIEAVTTEVQGLLNRLKAKLPLNPSTGEPTLAIKDSNLVKNHPEYVQGIYDYYFVKNDGSMGVHNAKYAVAILQKALGFYPTDVKPVAGEIPMEFALKQNYPNPFNPSTKFNFAIPQREHVRLEIYDILGKLVYTVVEKDLAAGNFEVSWLGNDENGNKVPSGVYLFRLQAGSFNSVKKMMLIK
jgi:hypothetical protein